ncbi:ferric reductase like transmembrane component-domain-containing protein [Nemania sp. NC0429]|nr:ferric reductase like transmembrane component-domain-containing protein [Nemania sp. NC0429]
MISTLTIFSLLFSLLLQHVSGAENGIIGFGRSMYEDPCSLACHDSLSTLYLSCTTFPDHNGMPGMEYDMEMGGGGMEMGPMGMTTEECRASNKPWLQTMAYCIQQGCGAHGYTVEDQARCFSLHAVGGASEPTFLDSLPDPAPTVELSMHDTWLNVTSLVNAHMYHATHGTLTEFAKSEYSHTRYSMILYLIVIGTCLISGIAIQLAGLFPSIYQQLRSSTLVSKLRQHIILPALFGSRHLEPLPGNLGYVPNRALGIAIGIYVSLNVIFSAVSFESFQPNIYFPSERAELCEYVGNRTGTLSLVNISIAILFAGRNNLLIAITGWSQTTFLTLHRWVARVATVQAIVHSIAYTIPYVDPGYEGAPSYAEKAAEPFYWWGIIGTIALGLAVTFAILPIRITLYELFLIVHIVLIILALVASWYHLVPHFGLEYGYQIWLYICFAFWSADRLARLARIAYYNRLGGAKAVVATVPGCNILHVTVFPRTAQGVGPGQHTFVYFMGLGRFWESHPFSIAAWAHSHTHRSPLTQSVSSSPSTSKSNGVYSIAKEVDTPLSPATDSIDYVTSTATQHQEVVVPREQQKHRDVSFQLLIRAHSGMTGKLQRHLSSHPAGSKVDISLYTEGYYAGHYATLQSLFTADTVLCLVGGMGITNALGYVQEYVSGTSSVEGEAAGKARGVMGRAKRFILAWSAKEAAFIDYVRKNFLANAHGVECLFWYTGSSGDAPEMSESAKTGTLSGDGYGLGTADTTAVAAGRMPIPLVMKSALEVGLQTTVLVCGPGQMADEARRQVASCVKDGFHVDIVEEAFAW